MAPGCEPSIVSRMLTALRTHIYGACMTGAGGGGFMYVLLKDPENGVERVQEILRGVQVSFSICFFFLLGTVRCRYNAVNFLSNPYNRHPIAHPWGRGIGCLLWVQIFFYIYSSAAVLLMWHAISWHIGQHYNGTPLYRKRLIDICTLYKYKITVGELRSTLCMCSTTFPWCNINASAAFAWL